jgi:tetratricopeptide (TPR) repeat protein
VVGYDDAARQWIVYDSYISDGIDTSKPYPGIRIPYGEMERLWRVFNGTYILLYDAARAAAAQQILADEADDGLMWQRSLERTQPAAAANPGDAFAWFNLGSSLVAQSRYADAASAFDQARVIGLPWRMLWYQFEPYEAYLQMGRYDDVITLTRQVVADAPGVEESYYYIARAYLGLGDTDRALNNLDAALWRNPRYAAARELRDSLQGEETG